MRNLVNLEHANKKNLFHEPNIWANQCFEYTMFKTTNWSNYKMSCQPSALLIRVSKMILRILLLISVAFVIS